MVRITMKDGGVIDLELDEKAAPITVENFLKLVNAKFYDGTIFHRVISGFMIQGGDPQGTGMSSAWPAPWIPTVPAVSSLSCMPTASSLTDSTPPSAMS